MGTLRIKGDHVNRDFPSGKTTTHTAGYAAHYGFCRFRAQLEQPVLHVEQFPEPEGIQMLQVGLNGTYTGIRKLVSHVSLDMPCACSEVREIACRVQYLLLPSFWEGASVQFLETVDALGRGVMKICVFAVAAAEDQLQRLPNAVHIGNECRRRCQIGVPHKACQL